ncbi:CTA4 [Candida pseudojiufengensis]|uniref:CTA4 n=1 Tax=Candida pseudojiufengensis TaxID=497109 RepID=UPI002224E0D3|nr:CTA4 [Candida pseudojiufengensis]KAI5960964.1 CTA4 [Candida pseudojiufengensis]
MSESKIRKRNKPTVVCSNCKRKKIKCDRKTPCTSCVRLNLGYSCLYEVSGKKSSSNLESQALKTKELETMKNRIKELEELLKISQSVPSSSKKKSIKPEVRDPILPPKDSNWPNPLNDDDEVLNFYTGYTALHIKGNIRRINFGPLSWFALLKRDPALSLVWKFFISKGYFNFMTVGNQPLTAENFRLLNSSVPAEGISINMDKFFRRKLLELEGFDEIAPYKSLEKYELKLNGSTNGMMPINESKMTFTQISLAKTIFDGRVNPELQLIEKIKKILPAKKVFWMLIDLFFQKVYPFFPFIDEERFKKDIQKIVGTINYEYQPFVDVKISKKLDLASIAICFIILRMTYLSLYSNRDCINHDIMSSVEDSDTKFLFLNPINASCIDVANSCIQCFQFTRKSNLTVFQAILFMRIYRNNAPEEEDYISGGDSQTATALLVQMAYSLGLNREPTNLDLPKDEKTNHLGRKIWAYLLRQDILHCASIGNPTSIHSQHFDAKRPYMTEQNSNIKDLELERAAVETFTYLDSELHLLRRLIGYSLDMKDGVKMKTITKDLHEFESILDARFNVMNNSDLKEEITMSKHNRPEIGRFTYLVKFKIFFAMKTAITSFYIHIYLHYEKLMDTELTFYYLLKILLIVTNDIMPYLGDAITGYLSSVGFTLNHNLQLSMHKCNEFIMSCLVRINFRIHSFTTNPEHKIKLTNDENYRTYFEKLNSIGQNLTHAESLIRKLMQRMSSRYYSAWRAYKAHSELLRTIADPEFVAKSSSGMKRIKCFQFTPDQLDEFDLIVSKLKHFVANIVHYTDSKDKPTPDFSIITDLNDIKEYTSEDPQNEWKVETMPNENQVTTTNNFNQIENTKPSSDIIDQMWLSLVAMKNDMSNNMENSNFQNMFGESECLVQEPVCTKTSEQNITPVNREDQVSPTLDPLPTEMYANPYFDLAGFCQF